MRYRITDEYSLVLRKGSANLYLEWREGGEKQRATTGTGELGPALQRARELILERIALPKSKPEEMLVVDVLDRYRLQHGKTLASKDVMRRAIALWRGWWRGMNVAEVTIARQEAFAGWLREQGHAEGYVRRVLGVGKAALNRAYHRGEIERVPWIALPPITESYPHYASRDQLVSLLNAKMPAHVWTYVMIRLCTGCRGDAALDLRPDQIDWTAKLIRLNPPGRAQTKKYRATVPLPDALAAVLRAADPKPCYVHWHGKRPASIKTTWRKLRVAAGLPAWFAPKVLRHTVATELRRRGVPDWEASGLLGHRVGGVTEIYAKFSPDYLGRARVAIDEWMADLARDVPKLMAQK